MQGSMMYFQSASAHNAAEQGAYGPYVPRAAHAAGRTGEGCLPPAEHPGDDTRTEVAGPG